MPGSLRVAPDEEGDAGQRDQHDGRGAGRQAVQAVGEVHGVGEAGQHQEHERVEAEAAQLQLERGEGQRPRACPGRRSAGR